MQASSSLYMQFLFVFSRNKTPVRTPSHSINFKAKEAFLLSQSQSFFYRVDNLISSDCQWKQIRTQRNNPEGFVYWFRFLPLCCSVFFSLAPPPSFSGLKAFLFFLYISLNYLSRLFFFFLVFVCLFFFIPAAAAVRCLKKKEKEGRLCIAGIKLDQFQ